MNSFALLTTNKKKLHKKIKFLPLFTKKKPKKLTKYHKNFLRIRVNLPLGVTVEPIHNIQVVLLKESRTIAETRDKRQKLINGGSISHVKVVKFFLIKS